MSLFELRTRYTRNYLTSAGKNCRRLWARSWGYTALMGIEVNHGVKIVYSKNLIDFKMERSIENMITDVRTGSIARTARFLNCRRR